MRSNEFDAIKGRKTAVSNKKIAEKEAILQKQVMNMSPAAPPGTNPTPSLAPANAGPQSTIPINRQATATVQPTVNKPLEEESFMLHGIKVTKDHPLWYHREHNTDTWQKAINWD